MGLLSLLTSRGRPDENQTGHEDERSLGVVATTDVDVAKVLHRPASSRKHCNTLTIPLCNPRAPQAVEQLHAAVTRMPSGPRWNAQAAATKRAQLLSACQYIRNALENNQTDAQADALGALHGLPQALLDCRPPTIADAAKSAAKSSKASGSGSSVEAELPAPLSVEMRQSICDWDFDIFKVPYDDLARVAFHAMCANDEITSLGVDHVKLWRYVRTVAERYHKRPFHNLRHAVDVTLAVSILARLVAKAHPEAFEDKTTLAALVVAAFAHDIDHPGCMNNFLVATSHPLAVLYANQSVLERHHCATATALLQRPENDFLAPLERSKRDAFLKSMQEDIIATDVTTSVAAIKEFQQRRDSPTPSMMAHLIIKAADISNPSKIVGVYEQWTRGVISEFFAQGDAERSLGLPISANCDRDSVVVCQTQVGFISDLVAPLFAALSQYTDRGLLGGGADPTLQAICSRIEENKLYHQR